MFPYVVADIGGTNARFALVSEITDGRFKFEREQHLKGAGFDSFEAAFSSYLSDLGGVNVRAACIAIAGPIQGDVVSMTNLPWSFSQQAMAERFELDAFHAINDYTALAVATSRLDESGLESVLSGQRNLRGNKAILGPGTGLGVAGLAFTEKFWLPVPSEGGHVNMAPSDNFECEVIQAAIGKFGHVSAEMCLSGPGLVNLYQLIAQIQGVQVEDIPAHEVSGRALAGSDDICRLALETFCALLGTVSGNLVLTYGASGGVYITGGIVPRFVDFLKQSCFEQRFREKGAMSHYLRDVPVDVVTHEQTAFLGAAAWLQQALT